MSFVNRKKLMEEGDTVLLYLGYNNLSQAHLKRGRVDQTRYGALKHDQLIGLPYGVKVECTKGWVYPLQPTAELWTLALAHRTQILYTPDISMIVFQLHLKPGSVVVEAGTGSGSLSHALIRAVMPTGRLHTFEFHAERCAEAKKEFERHGLSDFVTGTHRDVCAQGFDLHKEADAVFLDLPAPWECVASAKEALRPGGRICTFSPCMEQVQRTCETLQAHGFSDLTTIECLARPFSVQNVKLQQVDFGDATEEACSKDSKSSLSGRLKRGSSDEKRKDAGSEVSAKVARTEQKSEVKTQGETTIDVEGEGATKVDDVKLKGDGDLKGNGDGGKQVASDRSKSGGKKSSGFEFNTGAPPLTMQGHTGFLTFASLYYM